MDKLDKIIRYLAIGSLICFVMITMWVVYFDTDSVLKDIQVTSCHDGCIYSEWALYGKGNLSKPSEMYNECAKQCWQDKDPDYSVLKDGDK